MKIVFFGTPYYILPVLETVAAKTRALKNNVKLVSVVTQPPKKTGRKQFLIYSPVDDWAHKRNIPVFFNPEDLISNNETYDLGILASYGRIIPLPVINRFKYGILVVHPSLLPQFRGASPVQAAIVNSYSQTGGSIFLMDEKIDHGPVITQFKEDVLPSDTADSLRDRLFIRSAEVLSQMWEPFLNGKIRPKIQEEKQASYTQTISKEDGYIPPQFLKSVLAGKTVRKYWKMSFIKDCKLRVNSVTLFNFIRGMSSWPGAWTTLNIDKRDQRLKIITAGLDNNQLFLKTVQLEGKNPVEWKQFKQAYPASEFLE